jgi:flagellar basal-body rod modification protein FlgD
MSIEALASTLLTSSSVLGTSSSSSSKSTSSLDASDYLKLLMTELEYQDPTDPTDVSEMSSQFCSLTQLQESQETNDQLQKLLAYTSSSYNSQAVGFLGKTITYVAESGENATAVVNGITYNEGAAYLETENGQISMGSVTGVA